MKYEVVGVSVMKLQYRGWEGVLYVGYTVSGIVTVLI